MHLSIRAYSPLCMWDFTFPMLKDVVLVVIYLEDDALAIQMELEKKALVTVRVWMCFHGILTATRLSIHFQENTYTS